MNVDLRSEPNILRDKGIIAFIIYIYLNKHWSHILITQERIPMLAIPSMNDTHLEETLIINKLDVAVSNNELEAITEILKELLAHTSMHYFDEENMMKESLFPAYKTHKEEHDRHLGELQSVITYFEKHQDPRAIYAYIEGNLTPWILHHADTMDRMLALFLEEGATTACSATKGSTTGNC